MRFFSGTRTTGSKKVSPSELFKLKASGKVIAEKTPQEKYQQLIEDKMNKLMEDVIMGRKKARPKIPGTKSAVEEDEAPKELSKNAKLMLQMLAVQKAKKEQKKEKKKALMEIWSMKSKKKAEAFAKAAKEDAEFQKKQEEAFAYQKQQDDAAAAAAAAAAHSTDGGWW